MGRIVHQATVTNVAPGKITVILSAEADCGSCGLAGMCGHGGGRATVSLDVDPYAGYSVGDRLIVAAAPTAGRRAALLLVAAPCLCMFAGAFAAFALGASQTVSALTGLGAVAVWYAGVWLAGRSNGAVVWSVVNEPEGRRNFDPGAEQADEQ